MATLLIANDNPWVKGQAAIRADQHTDRDSSEAPVPYASFTFMHICLLLPAFKQHSIQ